MAKKVTVLKTDSDHPAGYVKKALACLMVRRLLWRWIVPGKVAKILPLKEIPIQARSIRLPPPIRRYMPARLPPAEVPQVHFKPPSSLAQWRDSHQEWLEALR